MEVSQSEGGFGEQTTISDIIQNLALPRFSFLLSQNINWAAIFLDKIISRSLSLPFWICRLYQGIFVKSPDFKLLFEAKLTLVTAETCSSF